MHRMDWDTRKPDNVSRYSGSRERLVTYVHEHNYDGVNHDDTCGAPKEHSVLRGYVSHLSGAENASASDVSYGCLPWLEAETLDSRAPGKTILWSRATADR